MRLSDGTPERLCVLSPLVQSDERADRIRLNGASRGFSAEHDRYDGGRSVEAGSRVVAWLCTARWDENGAALTGVCSRSSESLLTRQALICDHQGDLEQRNAAEADPARWRFAQLQW